MTLLARNTDWAPRQAGRLKFTAALWNGESRPPFIREEGTNQEVL